MTVETAAGPLAADLTVPADAAGLVVFVHGSGSSRHSLRNQAVARSLQDRQLATLLFDLLTPAEEDDERRGARRRFDVAALTPRLDHALTHVRDDDVLARLPIGLFGASTGAAVALTAAARTPELVRAVVSRGGRPDLAAAALSAVSAPTLLIVGGRDTDVLAMNRRAAAGLSVAHEVRIVENATHLFPEPGALEQVATWAGDWFTRYLPS